MKTGLFRRTELCIAAAACVWIGVNTLMHAHSVDPALFPAMIESLTAELAKSPETDLFIQRGEIFVHRKEWKKAEADFAAAARLDPERLVIDLLHGRALLLIGEPAKARPLLDRYIEQKPSQAEPWFLRGEIFAAMGKTESARADYLEGFRRAPAAGVEQVLAWSRLFAALPGANLAEVLSILDDAITRLGPAAPLIEYAVTLEIARQNYPAALARIDRVMPQTPWPAPLLALRGDILAKTGQPPPPQRRTAQRWP